MTFWEAASIAALLASVALLVGGFLWLHRDNMDSMSGDGGYSMDDLLKPQDDDGA